MTPLKTNPGEDDQRWMRRALCLAELGRDREDEVPVGAVIVRDGTKVAEGWNRNFISAWAGLHHILERHSPWKRRSNASPRGSQG